MKKFLFPSMILSSLFMIIMVYIDHNPGFQGEKGALSGFTHVKPSFPFSTEGNFLCRQKRIILSEFDGMREPGQWDIHQYDGWFGYTVSKDELNMDGSGGRNQHITRRGIMIDPGRPYVIEVDFTIDEPDDAPVPNSFCVNFNIAGNEGELDSISCWSVNLDIAPAGSIHAGVMKTMGFVNGRFREIKPSRKVEWCRMRTTYHMVIQAGKKVNRRFMQHLVSVSVYQAKELKDGYTTDFSTHPYQPGTASPVRIGLNTHGANWTVKNLKVYYIN